MAAAAAKPGRVRFETACARQRAATNPSAEVGSRRGPLRPRATTPQPGSTAAIALTSMSAPGTPSPATRAAVTSGGAPGPPSRGAMAP